MSTDTQQAAPEAEVEREIGTTDLTLQTMMRADLDVQISTAKAYPRSIKRFIDRALSLATFSPAVAESCDYALPRGTNPDGTPKILHGPSVRLAEIIFSTYGNIRVGARVVLNDGRWITAQGVCHDLETNVSMTIEVKRSIMQNEYRYDETLRRRVRTGKLVQMNDDMQTLVGNVACSIAYRNAIFKVVPKAAWANVYEEAIRVAKGDAKTLVARRDAALAYFRELKVTDEQICTSLGVASVEDIDIDKLTVLRGFATAVRNQEATLEAIFPPVKPPEKTKAAAATKAAEDKLKKPGAKPETPKADPPPAQP